LAQLRIPAIYMRGGTSKGVFFHARDLPPAGAARDAVLMRTIGSPDPYGKQIDGMGAATSSTSKVVIISRSERPDCDVDYLFGQVAIDRPVVDYSGNCGNLTAAVGPFAVSEGLLAAPMEPDAQGTATVRIWQVNIGKKIIAHVPVKNGEVVEEGRFALDGVAFPAAEVKIEFLEPGGMAGDEGGGSMFPSGKLVDLLGVPGVGHIEATLINAGNPTVFVAAESLGLAATERQADVDGNASLLEKLEAVRVQGALAMGLAATPADAAQRQHTPKVAFVAPPRGYTPASGKPVAEGDVDLVARIMSMGRLHHAMTGTGAVAIAVAAAIPGTLVHKNLRPGIYRENEGVQVRFGHASGTLTVGAEAALENGEWVVKKAVMSRSARRLMEGWVRVPAP
jgi:2-methylaconitate isomerase